jgi:hypothetical protein
VFSFHQVVLVNYSLHVKDTQVRLVAHIMVIGVSEVIVVQDRRRIEREAFAGHLLGIIATNALELGVDIGVLDAVIMFGFPGSVASFVWLLSGHPASKINVDFSANKLAGLDGVLVTLSRSS